MRCDDNITAATCKQFPTGKGSIFCGGALGFEWSDKKIIADIIGRGREVAFKKHLVAISLSGLANNVIDSVNIAVARHMDAGIRIPNRVVDEITVCAPHPHNAG